MSDPEKPNESVGTPRFEGVNEEQLLLMRTAVKETLAQHPEMTPAHLQSVRNVTVEALPDESLMRVFNASNHAQWVEKPDFFAGLLGKMEDEGLIPKS